MCSLHIYESFVGCLKEGIVCAELQGIQKAASQWLKLCLLPMAPRWGGLGDVGVVGICWSRSCKLCLSLESFEQYVSICHFGILLGSWGRSTIQKPSENRFSRAKTAKLALCLILCRFRVLAQMASCFCTGLISETDLKRTIKLQPEASNRSELHTHVIVPVLVSEFGRWASIQSNHSVWHSIIARCGIHGVSLQTTFSGAMVLTSSQVSTVVLAAATLWLTCRLWRRSNGRKGRKSYNSIDAAEDPEVVAGAARRGKQLKTAEDKNKVTGQFEWITLSRGSRFVIFEREW